MFEHFLSLSLARLLAPKGGITRKSIYPKQDWGILTKVGINTLSRVSAHTGQAVGQSTSGILGPISRKTTPSTTPPMLISQGNWLGMQSGNWRGFGQGTLHKLQVPHPYYIQSEEIMLTQGANRRWLCRDWWKPRGTWGCGAILSRANLPMCRSPRENTLTCTRVHRCSWKYKTYGDDRQ